jgi:hypothetical protein
MIRRPQELIAQVAAGELGIHETSTNRGPGIEKYWLATTYPTGMQNREPWCSAFASWCVQEADRQSEELYFVTPPRFPAVAQWLPWARAIQAEVIPVSQYDRARPGDIIIFRPHFSHVGIIERISSGWIHTIEGNTDDSGSREGREVARRQREARRYLRGSIISLPAYALPAGEGA